MRVPTGALVLFCWACGADSAMPTDAMPTDAMPTDALPTDALPTDGISAENADLDRGRPDSQQADPACAASCAIAARVGCPGSPANRCVERCEIALAGACGVAFRGLTECAAGLVSDQFECDASGASVMRAGVCAAELAAVVACLTP